MFKVCRFTCFLEEVACLDEIMTRRVKVDDRHFPGMPDDRSLDIVQDLLHHDTGERIEEVEIVVFIQLGEISGVTTFDCNILYPELPDILPRNCDIFRRYFDAGDLRKRVLGEGDEDPE